MKLFCPICKEICVSKIDLLNHGDVVHKLSSKEQRKTFWGNRLEILAMDDEGQEIVAKEEEEIQILAMDNEEQEIQIVAIPPGPPITNTGEKLNKCNKCDYASSQTSHLRSHLKTHSGEKSNNPLSLSSSMCDDILSQLKFMEERQCNQCGKFLKTEHDLRRHTCSSKERVQSVCKNF